MDSISENNKLIAEFMGVKAISRASNTMYYEGNESLGIELMYHKSWDWLMPVVEKIKCTDLSEEMVMDGVDELIDIIDSALCDTSIRGTYDAVVEFITRYNENK
jgi:hypothetical protein